MKEKKQKEKKEESLEGMKLAKREGKEEGGRRSRGITPSQRKTWGEEDSDEGE